MSVWYTTAELQAGQALTLHWSRKCDSCRGEPEDAAPENREQQPPRQQVGQQQEQPVGPSTRQQQLLDQYADTGYDLRQSFFAAQNPGEVVSYAMDHIVEELRRGFEGQLLGLVRSGCPDLMGYLIQQKADLGILANSVVLGAFEFIAVEWAVARGRIEAAERRQHNVANEPSAATDNAQPQAAINMPPVTVSNVAQDPVIQLPAVVDNVQPQNATEQPPAADIQPEDTPNIIASANVHPQDANVNDNIQDFIDPQARDDLQGLNEAEAAASQAGTESSTSSQFRIGTKRKASAKATEIIQKRKK